RAIRKAVGSSSSKDAGPSTRNGGFGSFDPWKKGILEGRQFDYMAAVIDDGNSWMAEPNIRMRTDAGSLSNPMRWANSIGGSKKEELVQWQRKLFAAGLYGGDEPIYGYYDRATAGALSSLSMEVLRHRNKYKPSEILEQLRTTLDPEG